MAPHRLFLLSYPLAIIAPRPRLKSIVAGRTTRTTSDTETTPFNSLVNLISTLLSSPQTPGPVPSSGSSCLSPPAVSPPSPRLDSLRSEISSIWPPAPSSYAEFGVLVPTAWDLGFASRTTPSNTRMQTDTDTDASNDSSETECECGDLICMWTIVDGRHVGSTPPITSTSRFVECIPDCGYDDMLGYADDVRFGCIKDLDLYDLISCEYQDEEVDETETETETLEQILNSMLEDRPRDRRAKMLPVRWIRMLSRWLVGYWDDLGIMKG